MSSITETFGVFVFDTGSHTLYSHAMGSSIASVTFTVLNIAGWIPGLSCASGIVKIFFGVIGLKDSQDDSLAPTFRILIFRGIVEVLCVGVIFAPVDIGVSIARVVSSIYSFGRE